MRHLVSPRNILKDTIQPRWIARLTVVISVQIFPNSLYCLCQANYWSCIALCRQWETTAQWQHRAAEILCTFPIGSAYCCVNPSSTKAHSITYYLFYPILKTDVQTTSQNATCSLFAPYLTLRVSWQVENCRLTAHCRLFLNSLHCIIGIYHWLFQITHT